MTIEEGKLRRLPPNIRATQAWKKSIKAIMEARGQPFTTIKDVLVGDVVIIMGDDELLDKI